MAQDPIKVDQIQVEPGAVGVRLLDRDPGTGSLRLRDGVVSAPLNLIQLAGLRNITNVRVVGKSGDGAAFTTIQSALDTVPANSSAANPYLVLVLPGKYTETVNIVRDGVFLVGLGEVTLESALEATPDAAGNDHTLIISAQLGTTPLTCHIEGFRITNVHTNKACVRIVGGAASTLLSDACRILRCRLSANAAAGNRAVWAATAGNLVVDSCEIQGGNQSLTLLQEMNSVAVRDTSHLSSFVFRYEVGQPEPAIGSGHLFVSQCVDLGSGTALVPAISIDCDGAGVAELLSVHMTPTSRILFSGGRTHSAEGCTLGVVSLAETVTLSTTNTRIASLLAPNAGAVFKVDAKRGSTAFVASDSEAVVFDIPAPDALYDVALELSGRPANDESPWVTGKAATGFTINFATNQTLSVGWKATR